MIVAVAVIIDGEVVQMAKPARHHDILQKYPVCEGHKQGEQGFIDDKEGFVSRVRAGHLACISGQLDELPKHPGNILLSEDLW